MSNEPQNSTIALSFTLILAIELFSGSSVASGQNQDNPTPRVEKGIAWFDATKLPVEGKGWTDLKKPFDRFPAKAETLVRPAVWNLSRHSAGMQIRFKTDSPSIAVNYEVTSGTVAMYHMPATGVSGIDLYGEDSKGTMRWIGVSRPTGKIVKSTLAGNLDKPKSGKLRTYTIYLPLYNGLEKLEIGVKANSKFEPVETRKNPILFYGTSIMHGACASRPGMSISAILGRRLNRPTMNLGFSGNGRMDIEIADLIGEQKPTLVAIDCLPNMNGKMVSERAIPFVEKLREHLPNVPVLLVEDRSFTNSEFFKSRRDHHLASRKALKAAFSELQPNDKHLYYLEGADLLGKDGEAATDGSHPNDLGMMRYADAYEEVLRKILR